MRELVHERPLRLVDAAGQVYGQILVYAEPLPGGTWGGWLEFVSADGEAVIPSDRETTQSTLQGVAYWATGLEPVYFEGALERALRRTAQAAVADSPQPSGGIVRLTVETLDPLLPLDIMATRTLTPGVRRLVHNGGVLVYEGCLTTPSGAIPGVYSFSAQFASPAAAAVLANNLRTVLHGRGAALEVDGLDVAISNGAIKDALLGAVAA